MRAISWLDALAVQGFEVGRVSGERARRHAKGAAAAADGHQVQDVLKHNCKRKHKVVLCRRCRESQAA